MQTVTALVNAVELVTEFAQRRLALVDAGHIATQLFSRVLDNRPAQVSVLLLALGEAVHRGF